MVAENRADPAQTEYEDHHALLAQQAEELAKAQDKTIDALQDAVRFKAERDAVLSELKRLRERVVELEDVIKRETIDHGNSKATGLPCKCFLCAALREAKP